MNQFKEEALNLIKNAEFYKTKNKIKKAIEQYEKAVYFLTNDNDKIIKADLYEKISRLYEGRLDYKNAIKNKQKSYELLDEIHPKHHIQVINRLFELACLYNKEKDYDSAEKYLKESLDIRRRLFTNNSLEVLEVLEQFFILYDETNRYENAISILKVIIFINLKDNIYNYEQLAILYNKLSMFYEANECYKKIIDLTENQFIKEKYKKLLNNNFKGKEEEEIYYSTMESINSRNQ